MNNETMNFFSRDSLHKNSYIISPYYEKVHICNPNLMKNSLSTLVVHSDNLIIVASSIFC